MKVSLTITEKSGLVVGTRSVPGNPLHGHTLAQQIEQTNTQLEEIGTKPTTGVVDLGFRGVDAELKPVEVVHRGKYKSLSKQQRRWLKRRQAIEPTIGHAKQDHWMDRCWLKGSEGDALHAVLCARRLQHPMAAAGHRPQGPFYGRRLHALVGFGTARADRDRSVFLIPCRWGWDLNFAGPTTDCAPSVMNLSWPDVHKRALHQSVCHLRKYDTSEHEDQRGNPRLLPEHPMSNQRLND